MGIIAYFLSNLQAFNHFHAKKKTSYLAVRGFLAKDANFKAKSSGSTINGSSVLAWDAFKMAWGAN